MDTMDEKEEEEIPLEIEDYSCNTFFEVTIGEIERYLVEEFRTRRELQRFLVNSKHHHCKQDNVNSNRNVVLSCNTGCGSVVLGRNFTVGHIGDYGKNEDMRDDEGIAVEIHVQDVQQKQDQQKQWHPIARLFALPLFFLARGTTTAPSYRTSESLFYLSLLTTAVGRAMRGLFSLCFDGDPSSLPSPFFYTDGLAPCFVSVGDHYQLAFAGVAPAVMVGDALASSDSVGKWPLSRLIAQPVVKCRFHCTAYPRPPEWCQYISDYLDMFQLQIGPQSRVRTEVFDGICVSLQRTFVLKVPRHFPVNNSNTPETSFARADMGGRRATITWPDILEIENETMLLSTGPTTFPFGTGTAPLRGVNFFFQWNQIHDTEVQDDGRRGSNLNPFASKGTLLQNKLTIKAVVVPKKECELNHAACKNLSEYAYRVMELVSSGEEELRPSQRISESLLAMADEIIYGHTVSLSAQKALIGRITKHQPQDKSTTRDIRHVYFPGSLLCRFAYVCATRLDAVDDVFTLWLLVVDRLKNLVECKDGQRDPLQQLIKTIGVPPVDEIDHGLPLLVQKLQLLSYCARRMLHNAECTVLKQPADGWDDESEDLSLYSVGEPPAELSEFRSCGVVSSTKRLITNGEPLVEPQALPTPPCTSDVLMVKAQELQNLGTASAGQHVRAWIQSDGLFNDMCMFLYANRAHEGRLVRFPDFVQWHSPRDFIPPLGDSKQSIEDDDAYLSERMRRNSKDDNGLITNVWWPLWNKATPQSPEEIIAQSFVPHEEARLILRWMEKDLSAVGVLLETVHANISNSLHRLLSHRCVENNPAIATYALDKSVAIAASLKSVTKMDDVFINSESLRSVYSIVIRRIGEIETCLCVSLATEQLLGAPNEAFNAPPADKPCASLGELIAAISSPTEQSEDLVLREALLNWDVWHHGGIQWRFTEDEQKPVAMRLRATCMAERPLNTTACFQQMIAETDETGVFRVALALAEEVL